MTRWQHDIEHQLKLDKLRGTLKQSYNRIEYDNRMNLSKEDRFVPIVRKKQEERVEEKLLFGEAELE